MLNVVPFLGSLIGLLEVLPMAYFQSDGGYFPVLLGHDTGRRYRYDTRGSLTAFFVAIWSEIKASLKYTLSKSECEDMDEAALNFQEHDSNVG